MMLKSSTGVALRCIFADTLSRAYLPHVDHPGKAGQEVERIHSVNFLSVSEPQIQEILEETARDAILQSLKAVILNRWPSQSESLPTELRHYFNIRDESAAHDGVIFYGAFLVSKFKTSFQTCYFSIQIFNPVIKTWNSSIQT